MKTILAVLAVLLLALCGTADGQVSQGGTPLSFDPRLSLDVGQAPALMMGSVNVDSLMKLDSIEDFQNTCNIGARRFGYSHSVDIGFEKMVRYDTVLVGSDSVLITRFNLVCPGARSINLIFNRFKLTETGRLFLYTPDRASVLGAFTASNNKPHGRFSTTLLPGDTLILEYDDLLAKAPSAQLNIAQVVHGYRGVFSGENGYEICDNCAAPCERDINCEEGHDWCREKRSVCLILHNNRAICTGTILNDPEPDEYPYILSAFHCIKYTDADAEGNEDAPCGLGDCTPPSTPAPQSPICGINLSQLEKDHVSDWMFVFGYYNILCNNSVNVDIDTLPTFSGATFKAASANSDFVLLQLQEQPGSEHGLHYAGWNKSGTLTSTTGTPYVGIHHPYADRMKISTVVVPPASSYWDRCPVYTSNTNWWKVEFGGNSPPYGATEVGSSGSALFNPDHHVIGQLTGNRELALNPDGVTPDFCAVPKAWYGKLSYSWTGDGTSATSLQDWLGPVPGNGNSVDGEYTPIYLRNMHIQDESRSFSVFNTLTIEGKALEIINNVQVTGQEFHVEAPSQSQLSTRCTLQSPRRITIRKGVRIDEGTYFRAYIDEVDCDEVDIVYRGHKDFSATTPKRNTVTTGERRETQRIGNDGAYATAVPNPTRGIVDIRFSVPRSGHVKISIFDIQGRHITDLIDVDDHAAGDFTVTYDTERIPSGDYVYIYTVDDHVESHALKVIR